MENIINLGIPHVGEQVFQSMNTEDLLQCLEVSETWKVLAKNVLLKKWKGKLIQAYEFGHPNLVQLLLDHCSVKEKFIAQNLLLIRWKGHMFKACQTGKSEIVKLLLEKMN